MANLIKDIFKLSGRMVAYSICIPIIKCKRMVAQRKRYATLQNNPEYVDMYSAEGKRRISQYKFNTEDKEEQVACNFMLLSSPINYAQGLGLRPNDIERIMKIIHSIKEKCKVA